jgi:hypothetical protein
MCGGSCAPSSVQCGGLGIQVCDSTGTWTNQTTCPGCTPSGPNGHGSGVLCDTCGSSPACLISHYDSSTMDYSCICPP